ncbi:MAG: hypothetical protein ACUVXI_00795 [bacterium]
MNILILYYSKDRRLEALAHGIKRGAESSGNRVSLRRIDDDTPPKSLSSYQMVFVGSPVIKTFRATIPNAVKEAIEQWKPWTRRSIVAFVPSKLIGANRGIRALMSCLEKQGAMVNDFMVLGSIAQAERFGIREYDPRERAL